MNQLMARAPVWWSAGETLIGTIIGAVNVAVSALAVLVWNQYNRSWPATAVLVLFVLLCGGALALSVYSIVQQRPHRGLHLGIILGFAGASVYMLLYVLGEGIGMVPW